MNTETLNVFPLGGTTENYPKVIVNGNKEITKIINEISQIEVSEINELTTENNENDI